MSPEMLAALQYQVANIDPAQQAALVEAAAQAPNGAAVAGTPSDLKNSKLGYESSLFTPNN